MKNKIADYRKTKELTQAQLAELAGLTNYTLIQRYERGMREPGVCIALRIAKALDCTVEDLFELEEND